MKPIFYLLLICMLMPLLKEANAVNIDFFNHPEEIILYNENQPNAKNLKKCAMNDTPQYSCLLVESPFIGQNIDQVSVEDIMNRTMATRKSYLQTFKNLLQMMPPEGLMMFGAVNAVVISDRINPSFYSYVSGAIYISGNYLWKTAEEKLAAKQTKDMRESYKSPLSFSEETDYYKDGKPLHRVSLLGQRTEKDIAPLLFKVLFHELSHANDFFPKSFYTSSDLPIAKTFNEAAMSRMDEGLLLSQKTYLSSALLSRFSEIFDYGKEATDIEKNMDAKYVIDEYIEGEASDLYAYANAREDFAMMVENNLMYYFLNYSSMTVFIRYPKADYIVPAKYKKPIAGGVKQKIAAPQVKERGSRMLSLLFDEEFVQKMMDKLDKSKQTIIPKNASWKNLMKLN